MRCQLVCVGTYTTGTVSMTTALMSQEVHTDATIVLNTIMQHTGTCSVPARYRVYPTHVQILKHCTSTYLFHTSPRRALMVAIPYPACLRVIHARASMLWTADSYVPRNLSAEFTNSHLVVRLTVGRVQCSYRYQRGMRVI